MPLYWYQHSLLYNEPLLTFKNKNRCKNAPHIICTYQPSVSGFLSDFYMPNLEVFPSHHSKGMAPSKTYLALTQLQCIQPIHIQSLVANVFSPYLYEGEAERERLGEETARSCLFSEELERSTGERLRTRVDAAVILGWCCCMCDESLLLPDDAKRLSANLRCSARYPLPLTSL